MTKPPHDRRRRLVRPRSRPRRLRALRRRPTSLAARAAARARACTPRKFGLLRLNAKKKFPASVLPQDVFDRCSPETVKIGTVCMMTSPYPLEKDDIGKNDYFFATQKCAELGGYLPTAAQLIGAAPYVKLAGRVDDNEVTASTDVDPTDGLKDRREMSASLTTTASGGRAAGSQGVSEGLARRPQGGRAQPGPAARRPRAGNAALRNRLRQRRPRRLRRRQAGRPARELPLRLQPRPGQSGAPQIKRRLLRFASAGGAIPPYRRRSRRIRS